MTRRGFTVLEVMLASGLSLIVLMAALGVMGFLSRADRLQAQRFDDLAELGTLHATVRRAMQTLVASPAEAGPAPDPGMGRIVGADDQPPEVKQIDLSGREIAKRKRFMLEPQTGASSDENTARRVEVVLLEQPVGPELGNTPTVRGMFEITPRVDGLALQWKPLIPPGEPIILATRLFQVRWTALAREMVENRFGKDSAAWRHDLAADFVPEFPKALRLEIVTMSGTHVDWLFEPAITTGPEP